MPSGFTYPVPIRSSGFRGSSSFRYTTCPSIPDNSLFTIPEKDMRSPSCTDAGILSRVIEIL